MSKEKKVKSFGAIDQVAYFFGDAGGSFVNMLVDSYFLTFCTYVLHISPGFTGTLFLVARIWDAINDPLIGSIPDRFLLGKSGDRFKPYVRLMMVPLALSGILCFTNVSSFPDVWKHIWVAVAYILVGMCYTGASMPYGSLASVISDDAIERAKLSRARSFGGAFVAILLAVVPQFVYDKEDNPLPTAFFAVAVVFGICSILSYILLLANTTERVHYEVKKEEYKYTETMKSAFTNRPLVGTMIAAIGFLFYNTGFNQLSPFLFREYYHNTGLITIAALISMPLMIIIFPLVPKLVRKFGKVKSVLVPTLFGVVVAAFLFFVPVQNPYLFLALNILAITGPMCYALNCWAIVGDCIDYHEYKHGVRADGSIYSIYTFSRKIGSAFASAFISYALQLIGFVTDAKAQTAEVANRIRYIATSVPLIACILIIIGLGLIYNLSMEESNKINAELKERHQRQDAK